MVDLLRSILVVRSLNGNLGASALEELIMILKAASRLCERVSHWKPSVVLKEKVKSITNREIKVSLQQIAENYQDALEDLRAAERDASARVREDEFAEAQDRLEQARKQNILDKRLKMATNMQNQIAREAEQRTVPFRGHSRSVNGVTTAVPEVYDVDDLASQKSTPSPTTDFEREATADIPGPTRRVWQPEETIALSLLLQKHRGPDRYVRIQEVISEVARDLRKIGPDKFLQMAQSYCFSLDLDNAGDVLDDLGNMEVADIEQQAKYLKASLARRIDADIRANGEESEWAFLSDV